MKEWRFGDLEAVVDVSKSIMKTLEKNGYIKFVQERLERNPLIHKNIERDEKLELTVEQKAAYDQIEFMLENEEFAEFLLHGVTGSRKNVYYGQYHTKSTKTHSCIST